MTNPIVRKIRQLSASVADKIAAGEVVDRPLSVVKELLENAVDAGANNIAVEIQGGGKTYIRVTDNGCGILPEDVETAFLRHATSKITEAEDLEHIQTLGFRGEALASIAAVSRVEIITKPEEARTGIRLLIEGGRVVRREDTGCPTGTTIIVRDLFYNTPARLKFMRRDTTESALIIDFVSKMALAYPNIKLRCINNGSILFSTQGKGDTYANILTIFSKETGRDLIPVRAQAGDFSVEAYITPPDKNRSSRKHQIYFVNGRHIVSKVLDRGVSDAYDQRLPEGRYPVVFLFLQVPPEFMDVNIHPNKREVRFHDEREVGTFITQAFREALRGGDALAPLFAKAAQGVVTEKKEMVDDKNISLTSDKIQKREPVLTDDLFRKTAPQKRFPDFGLFAKSKSAVLGNKTGPGTKTPVSEAQKATEESIVKEEKAPYSVETPVVETWKAEPVKPAEIKDFAVSEAPKATPEPKVQEHQTTFKEIARGTIAETASPEAPKKAKGPFEIEDLRITGNIFATYITAVDEDYFYLIDQHAAHERIFYEKLLTAAKNKNKDSQLLLTPI